MAICTQCGGEMTEQISCKADPIMIGGQAYDPVRWGEEWHPRSMQLREFCRATPLGGVHHPGCCVECCPVCLGQALGCTHFEENQVDDWDTSACDVPRRIDRCTAHLFLRAGRGGR